MKVMHVIGDPLDPHYIVCSWDALWDAAEALVHGFAPGKVYTQFTRDLTPDYAVSVHPSRGHDKVAFFRYAQRPDGTVFARYRRYTGGFTAACSVPKWHPVAKGAGFRSRQLVQVTAGAYRGWWLDADLAHEVIP